ncbi:flagellar biosynthesis protein FlhF [Neobacillus mesonae]|uniref:flagellar biosynthesis protein FlhF n=1 Tax=Neobacillus mesonae TaxID=1193713 RepID=UPI00203C4D98|nr:flagellar biosynthesis protein FlhF [Neobacillus mesonae]MCM3569580.1 flagellar biosynthesis protein FlhF [Neobacillus mesonae]
MKTKKIVADSIPLALKMVRQQLGDNAIIVNTRAIKSGGLFGFFAKQKFEVTAYSMEKEAPQPEREAAIKEKIRPVEKGQSNPVSPEEEELEFSNETKAKLIENVLVKRNHLHVYGDHSSEDQNQHAEGFDTFVGEGNFDSKSSVFHKKPQMLYQLYSHPAEKVKTESVSVKPAAEPENPLLDEIKSLRNMMMTFMTGEKQESGPSARLSKWTNRLKKQGVADEVLEYIVMNTINTITNQFGSLEAAAEEDIEKEIIAIVQGMIEKRVPKSNVLPEDIRMINIIGPTGVGKTTSIAKLATEQILKQKRRVAMITTDVYRIAAVEQLKTYAGILNVPIEVAHSREELDQAIEKLKHFDLIYMDTTGRNFKDEKNRESVREFLTYPLKSDHYLALSLTTKYEDLTLILNEFLDSPVNKLILTKFDETTSYGTILNIAFQYPYEMVYITNGQSVPEDITFIDAGLLAHSIAGDDR